MQHPSGREGKRTCDQYSAKIKPGHAGAVYSDIAAPGGEEGDRDTNEGHKTEEMDEPKMIQEPRSDFRWHDERNEPGRQHEQHIDLSKTFMAWGAFAPEQLKQTDDKCRHDSCQMQIC